MSIGPITTPTGDLQEVQIRKPLLTRIAKAERTGVVSAAQTVVTNAGQVVGVLLLTTIVARVLGAEGKGEYDLCIATAMLIQIIFSLSLPSGVAYTVASRRVNIAGLVRRLALFALLEGLLAGGVLLVAGALGWQRLLIPTSLQYAVPIVMVLVAAQALSMMARSLLSGSRRFTAANAGDLFKQAMAIALALAAVAFAFWMGMPLLFGLVVAQVSAVLLTGILYLRFGQLGVESAPQADAGFISSLRFALPCYGANISQFLNYRLDLFFVNAFKGHRAVGIYMTAVLLAQAVNMIPAATQSVLFPTVASRAGSVEVAAMVARANRVMTVVALLIGCVLAATAPFVIPFAFGPDFRDSVLLLLLLLPGCIAFSTTNVLAGYFLGVGRPKINMMASMAGLVLTVILDIVLIPKYGAIGAAVASTISYWTSTAVTVFIFRRETRTPFFDLFRLRVADVQYVWQKLASRKSLRVELAQ